MTYLSPAKAAALLMASTSLSAAAAAVFSRLDVTPAEIAAEVKERGMSRTVYWHWETMLHGYCGEEEIESAFNEAVEMVGV